MTRKKTANTVTAKLAQIPGELTKNGIPATPENIAAVEAIVRADGRVSVPTAIRIFQSNQGNQVNNQSSQVNQSNQGNQANSQATQQDQWGKLTDELATQGTQQITSIVAEKIMNNLATGNWGTLHPDTQAKLNQFTDYVKTNNVGVVSENFLPPASPIYTQNMLSFSGNDAEEKLLLASSEAIS